MQTIRPPAVAGMFYPADAGELQTQVNDFLRSAAATNIATDAPPKALIAPHAGYIYSGPIAASAYARVRALREQITRVVLLGPAHRVAFRGLAASSARAFRTPLGDIPVDSAALSALSTLPQVRTLDEAHAQEHSLEVQLPFLQTVLDSFTLLPLVVGDATYAEVAEVLEHVWGGPETLIVISSDLSHYHDYVTAQRMDTATSHAIETLQPERIDYEHACGRTPVGGLLTAARAHGLHAEIVDLRNSGDTAGPRDQVVGYGAYVIH
ncbi:MAG: AmmeMemoRadiSam system protein B [Gammaproteobacteria bacterium]|nr:AmmeMemoRadiSam system protein B [Gammaproteobacteria bacterium]